VLERERSSRREMVFQAPAKLNLCLYLGPRRDDGLHELTSIFCPLSLADEITIEPADADEVVSAGVEGPNLAAAALTALRNRGWAHPPVRVEIRKRIPVAAGLGGGSADAAAVLRLAAGEVEGLEEIAASLGADVPSQLEPRAALVRGAGERVEPLPHLATAHVAGIAFADGLATADVYAEADRLGLGRDAGELADLAERLRKAAAAGRFPLAEPELAVNDLEPAALSLRPEIGDALDALRDASAAVALVAGSGPTAIGLFGDADAAGRAASAMGTRFAATFTAKLEVGS
jgi:4-diphosphocytidyl-2-C-methyl-D-erythritol kinase